MTRRSRRRVVRCLGAGLAGLAGCLGRPGGSDDTSPADDGPTPGDDGGLPVGGEWPQRGYDPGHGAVSDAVGVPDRGTAYWQRRRIRSGPAILADGRLYHYAELGVDPDGTPTPTTTPATGTAHPVSGTPHVVARDAATGAMQWWSKLATRPAGWPAAAGDLVVATTDGEVVAVEAATGTRRWTDDLPPARGGDAGSFPRPVGDPTVVGQTVLVPLPGVVDGQAGDFIAVPRLRAYDVGGDERWTVRLPKRALGVAATGETAVVVAADWGGTAVVSARRLDDGRERWRAEVPATYFRGPVVAGGTVYVGSSEGPVHALALADGRELWSRATPGVPPAVAADGDAAYVAADGELLKLAAGDGSVRWRAGSTDGTDFGAPPAVGEGTVYAGGSGRGGRLVALDTGTGDERWHHTFPTTTVEGDISLSGVRNAPAVGDAAVFVDAVDGLYGFGPARE